MMVGPLMLVYFSAGVITSVVTLALFPPEDGFRPSFALQTLALTCFILLWPLLVLLAAWYQFTQFVQRSFQGEIHDSTVDYVVPRRVQVAKPK